MMAPVSMTAPSPRRKEASMIKGRVKWLETDDVGEFEPESYMVVDEAGDMIEPEDINALLDELEAARKVVEAASKVDDGQVRAGRGVCHIRYGDAMELTEALAAYHEATKEPEVGR